MASSNQMIALLGMLAVAGYQNRDKLGELLGKVTGGGAGVAPPLPRGTPPTPSQGTPNTTAANAGLGGLLGSLGGLLGGSGQAGAGGGIGGILGELMDSFSGNGHGDTVRSWVETGP